MPVCIMVYVCVYNVTVCEKQVKKRGERTWTEGEGERDRNDGEREGGRQEEK